MASTNTRLGIFLLGVALMFFTMGITFYGATLSDALSYDGNKEAMNASISLIVVGFVAAGISMAVWAWAPAPLKEKEVLVFHDTHDVRCFEKFLLTCFHASTQCLRDPYKWKKFTTVFFMVCIVLSVILFLAYGLQRGDTPHDAAMTHIYFISAVIFLSASLVAALFGFYYIPKFIQKQVEYLVDN
jgi:hypothetical protein